MPLLLPPLVHLLSSSIPRSGLACGARALAWPVCCRRWRGLFFCVALVSSPALRVARASASACIYIFSYLREWRGGLCSTGDRDSVGSVVTPARRRADIIS